MLRCACGSNAFRSEYGVTVLQSFLDLEGECVTKLYHNSSVHVCCSCGAATYEANVAEREARLQELASLGEDDRCES